MSNKKILCNVLDSIENNNKIYFNNKEVSIRDEALVCYYLVKAGKTYEAIHFINNIVQRINNNINYQDITFCLWIIGEYINKTHEYQKLNEFSNVITFCLKYINNQWKVPEKNWIGIENEGIYITNIAFAYGAVQSINNTLKNSDAQKLLIEIKDFIFKNFISGGKVVSKLGSTEIFGDISIIAVPFALLDAGNQIITQSINILEKQLVTSKVRMSKEDTFFGGCERSDLTCLLAWYYSEKGNIVRAKWLLRQVDKMWDKQSRLYDIDICSSKEKIFYDYWLQKNEGKIKESYLNYVLYAIAAQNISLKEQNNTKSSAEIEIIHHPTGTANPYLFENFERYPRHPIENDKVFLKMITQPFYKGQKAYVEYTINKNAVKREEMQIETSINGEKYWSCYIGTFSLADNVKYKFIVENNNTTMTSKTYTFIVRKWLPVGDILHTFKKENSIEIYFKPLANNSKTPCFKIEKFNAKTIKCSFYIKNNKFISNKNDKFSTDATIKLDKCILDIKNLFMKILDDKGNSLLESYKYHNQKFIELLIDGSGAIYKIRYKFLLDKGEQIYGMGERYSNIELTNHNIDNYVYNQYTEQGFKTYIPIPFTISSKGYGIYIDTTMYSVFRFGTKLSDLIECEIDIHNKKQYTDFYIFIGKPKEIIKQFTNITGKPKLPPKWVFGPWMSSNNWDRQEEIYRQVELMNKYKIPATVIVIEQWSDEATFYIFNDAQYKVKNGNEYLRYEDFDFPEWGRWPNPKKMTSDLHKVGLKLLLWQAPVQKFMDGISHTQRDMDEKTMLENNYCVRYKNGKPYRIPAFEWFKGSLVPDFSNPMARDWWFKKRLYLLENIGIDGFKTDGGECIYGEDLLFYDGSTGKEMRNKYPSDYVKSYHDFVCKHVNDGGITFSRAGYGGAQKIPVHWAGDENSTFRAFKASLIAGLSCSMSGIPFWGWDLAGFHGSIPTAELYLRATQMATFCPIMQYHAETKAEFNNDRTPWNIAERTENPYVIDIYKRYADLRMNLLPYIYNQAIQSSLTGIPMMRAMFIEYPDDPSCMNLVGQYMFGDSLLIAPIIEEGDYNKEVYFPNEKWMDFFTGEIITGNNFINIKLDIDYIPAYIRENSIIPLNLSDDYMLCSEVGNKINTYENLCFMFFITNKIKYHFKDDLDNIISIYAVKYKNKLSISLSTNHTISVILILQNVTAILNIKINKSIIKEVENVYEVQNNSYCICDNNLIIKVDCPKGETDINIECYK